MNDPRKETEFVEGLLSEGISDEIREASLKAMLARSSQRHQRRRVTTQIGATLAFVAFSALLFFESDPSDQKLGTNPIVASVLEGRRIEGTPIKVLSDEDLFALFPEQSLGVVGADEDYRLVFLDQREWPADSGAATRHFDSRP